MSELLQRPTSGKPQNFYHARRSQHLPVKERDWNLPCAPQHKPPSSGTVLSLSRLAVGLCRFNLCQPTQDERLVSLEKHSPHVKSNSVAIQSFKRSHKPLDHISVSSTNKRRATYPQLHALRHHNPSDGCSVSGRSRHRRGGAERRPWRFWLRDYDLLPAYGGASLPLKREPSTQNVL